MPTIVKTDSGTWKAVIRKTGFPTTTKTFRLKRDAEDWARTTEDEMVRGMYVIRVRPTAGNLRAWFRFTIRSPHVLSGATAHH